MVNGRDEEECSTSSDPKSQSTTDFESLSLADLKNNRIAELKRENQHLRQTSLCNICLNTYSKPVVSTVCWHVHCEICWLRSLGAKKLCPQCKVIVQPKNLRKIYLWSEQIYVYTMLWYYVYQLPMKYKKYIKIQWNMLYRSGLYSPLRRRDAGQR